MKTFSVKTIRFLHIPKTAGMAFIDCLRLLYYKGKHFHFSGNFQNDLSSYQKLETSQRERITLVTGHSPRITGIPEIDNLPTITFLRKPIDRVRSFCQHVSEGKSENLLNQFPPDTFDLNEFLNSGKIELANLQTRYLLGEKGFALPDKNPIGVVNQAISVLENNMAAFGITECFESSLMLFRFKMGWKQWPVYQRLNVKNRSRLIAFNKEQLETIKALNHMDIQVYERALNLFNKTINSISDYLEENVKQFRRYQKASVFFFAPLNSIRAIKWLTKHCTGGLFREG